MPFLTGFGSFKRKARSRFPKGNGRCRRIRGTGSSKGLTPFRFYFLGANRHMKRDTRALGLRRGGGQASAQQTEESVSERARKTRGERKRHERAEDRVASHRTLLRLSFAGATLLPRSSTPQSHKRFEKRRERR
ncbi:unnamed protein product [Bubo scandiacus]